MKKYRLARVISRRGRRQGEGRFVSVRKDGRVAKADRDRTGYDRVAEWVVIRASTWREATRAYWEGEGTVQDDEDRQAAPPSPFLRGALYGSPDRRRPCPTCIRASPGAPLVPGNVRHVHELIPGEHFRFAAREEVFTVVSVGPSRTTIRAARGGKPRYLSSTATVIPASPAGAAGSPARRRIFSPEGRTSSGRDE